MSNSRPPQHHERRVTSTRALVDPRPAMDLAGLFARNHALYGDAVMTAGGPGDNPPAPTPGAPAPAAGDKTFSQADMTATAAREAAAAKAATEKAVADLLGMTPEEAKAKLDKATEAERAAMDEATRKAAEAADAKTAADKATADAAQATVEAKITQQLLVTGLALSEKPEEHAEQVSMAVRLVNVPANADDAAIKTAVDRVKTMVPALFTPGTGAPAGGGQSDGGNGPGTQHVKGGAFGKGGDEEFARRFPQKAGAPT